MSERPPAPEPIAEPQPPAGSTSASTYDPATSPLARFLGLVAAFLAVGTLAVAALPLPALERLLATKTHWRTEQVAIFVEGHRLDIVVAGVAALLVAAVVAVPSVLG